MAQVGERRCEHRGRTFLFGQVFAHDGQATLECVVRNLSADGAKLDFPDVVSLPNTFDLSIRHKGDSRRARLVWHDYNQIGVSFVEAPGAVVVSIEIARQLRKLAQDQERLARRIAQLSEPRDTAQRLLGSIDAASILARSDRS